MTQRLLLVKIANIKWSNLDADDNECDISDLPVELTFTLRSVTRDEVWQIQGNLREEIEDYLLNKYYFVPLNFNIAFCDDISEE